MTKETFNFVQDYSNTPLFCGGSSGLFDTIHKKNPQIWSLYKQMKALDWDENETSFSSCMSDFERCDKSTYDIMIKTLAWQWEGDSAASRLSAIISPFISSSELWAAWQRISDNEVVHAATYSEIVRSSFKDPSIVLNEVLAVKESLQRLDTVYEILHETSIAGHKYALGMLTDDEAYPYAIMFTVAMLCLERIQFLSSFATTFAICDTGLFGPIGTMVQKIAQDELEIHVELDKAVLKNEMNTARGAKVLSDNMDKINKMIDEVTLSELDWVEYLFSDGRSIVGLNAELLKQWSCYNAKDVYNFFKIKPISNRIVLPKNNPLPFMEDWLNISKKQPSPQEQDVAQYKVNLMVRDDEEIEFDV